MNVSLLSNALQSASSSFGETIGELASKVLKNKVAMVVGIIFMALTALYLAYRYGSCCLKSRPPEARGEEPLSRQILSPSPQNVQTLKPLHYNCKHLVEKLPTLKYRLQEGEEATDDSLNRIRDNMSSPVMRIEMANSNGSIAGTWFAIKMRLDEKNEGLLLLNYESDPRVLPFFSVGHRTTNISNELKEPDDIGKLLSIGSLEINGQKWHIPDYAQFRETVKDIDLSSKIDEKDNDL